MPNPPTGNPLSEGEREDPTSRGDRVAADVRRWYEANRETWWVRRKKLWQISADDFILGLINEVHRAEDPTALSPDSPR